MPLPDLVRATGLTSGYCWRIRRGDRTPHAMDWAPFENWLCRAESASETDDVDLDLQFVGAAAGVDDALEWRDIGVVATPGDREVPVTRNGIDELRVAGD